MTAPNIAGLTSIIGKSNVLIVPLTTIDNATAKLAENVAGSGQVFKVNSAIISNITTSDADVSIALYRGGVPYYIANTIKVPVNSTLISISKDMGIYLEEGDTIQCIASAETALHAICSFEVINDA